MSTWGLRSAREFKQFFCVLRRCAHLAERAEADAQIRAYENTCIISDGAISKIDFAQLPANNPIEDYYSSAKCLASNAYFFGVFDGHGGAACSRHVSIRLFDYLCASVLSKHIAADVLLKYRLKWIYSSAGGELPPEFREKHYENVENFYKRISEQANRTITVRSALESSFLTMDEDISKDAYPNEKGRFSRVHAHVAAAGSCGVVGHVRKNHLHIANVGDSIAVLGTLHHDAIIPRPLSKLHCIENTDEMKRVRNEHPISEFETILRNGRLLGELYPLRAFGDVRYKWPLELQRSVLAYIGSSVPPGLRTPPYLSVMPEVFYHRLTANDRFLVLASDGLWEWLDADTVVRLVYDHTIGIETLSPYKPKRDSKLSEICVHLNERAKGECKRPLDENSATHLLRYALGGCSGGRDKQYDRLRDMLRTPPGVARNYRDDISVIIVHLNPQYLESISIPEP